jgi:hypothetical protein
MSLRDASNPASLRRADLLKLLDLIVGLHETTDPAALPHRMMEAMLQLVPADAAGYSTIDLATGRATNDSTFGNPPEFVRAIERNMAQHPVIAHLRTHVEHQARAISDFTSPAAFQSLALYDELYRPMRVQDQIAIALKSGSTLQIGLTASRNAWGFSSRERLLFTLLRPHVLYCHENARRLTELKAQSDAWLYRLEQLPQGLAARDRCATSSIGGRRHRSPAGSARWGSRRPSSWPGRTATSRCGCSPSQTGHTLCSSRKTRSPRCSPHSAVPA